MEENKKGKEERADPVEVLTRPTVAENENVMMHFFFDVLMFYVNDAETGALCSNVTLRHSR